MLLKIENYNGNSVWYYIMYQPINSKMNFIDFKPNLAYHKSKWLPCLRQFDRIEILSDAYEVRQCMNFWVRQMGNNITIVRTEIMDFELDGAKLEKGHFRVWYTKNTKI